MSTVLRTIFRRTTFLRTTVPTPSTGRTAVAAAMLALLLAGAGCAHVAAAPADACAAARISPAAPLLRVPFQSVDGRIYVPVRVNGRGPFRFAVDTGASGLARADASLVATLGLPLRGATRNSDGVQSADADTVRLDTLALGGLVRHNVEAITRDYARGGGAEAAFAGILAREFFADGLLVIDYPARTLTFSREASLALGDRNVLAYERAFRIPVAIGDLRTQGNLDTGANVRFVVPQALHRQLAATAPQAAGRASLANTVVATQRSTVHGPFRIGALQLADVEVRVSARYPELLIGAHALADTVVLIDQRAKAVALCPSPTHAR